MFWEKWRAYLVALLPQPAWPEPYKDAWAVCLVACMRYLACTSGCNFMGGCRMQDEDCGPTRQSHRTDRLHPLLQSTKHHLSFLASAHATSPNTFFFWNTDPPSLRPLMHDIRCNPNPGNQTHPKHQSITVWRTSIRIHVLLIDLNCASKQIKMDGSLTSQVQLQTLPAIYWSLKITTWLHTSQVAQQANMTNIRMHMHYALS